MLITMLVRRTTAQHCTARLSCWTVRQGDREIARVTWDPSGPLDVREAAMQALRALLTALEAPRQAQTQTV
jgi:hypothetical protein